MFPNPEPPPEDLLADLRSRSPAALLASILTGVIVLALAINVASSVLYDSLSLLFVPGGDSQVTAQSVAQFRLDLGLGILAVLIMIPAIVYLWKLSDQQAPQVQRIITLLLPFARIQGHVVLIPIESLAAHEGLDQILNWAIEKGDKEGEKNASQQWERLDWDGCWRWPPDGSGSPIHDDAVTIIYDLVEWMVVRELDNYGKHLYAGRGKFRPGDDLVDTPPALERQVREAMYENVRPNYLWRNGNRAEDQKLKLPEHTIIALETMPPDFGVKEFSHTSVRAITIKNPGGSLTVIPSQIWRKATRPQYQKLIEKQSGMPADVYALEMRLAATVKLNQWTFYWPWASKTMANQRWLLELQAQLVRHMDMDRYIEFDYRRMLVDVRDAGRAKSS